ncbi:ImmA/IrrE family metallo-endopeptidase [Galbibacter mesophilus]|uniref:ImmA/IrrE family metallo-endopeptidase n=1 Tax=Galbibacter mesophilus TaxID=379069 RepID=UPI00191F2FD7|nr:hypothetical protein [Galbibacter mesophilus]MCM5664428.1 hypothetical protein [Galbibacter mesophilus]
MEKTSETFTNKRIPISIRKEVETALSYFPDLKNVPIEFKFKEKLERSFMQAQPEFSTVFNKPKRRRYYIFISSSFNIEGEKFTIDTVPKDVLIGWIGHELGHIMDYLHRGSLNLIWFGIKYIFVGKHIREAERAADVFAVNHGMGDYILETKNFILNHTSLSETYKNRIKRLYLSPEDILQLTQELAPSEKISS